MSGYNYFLFILSSLISLGSSLHAFCQDITRPNVLLIVVDDMGFGDITMSGNPMVNTPNLDLLSTQSINFTNFNVSPVCAPTRASLLTGRYHQRTGVRSVTNGFETLNPDELTMAEIFSSQGYRTGLFGKWHLGENYPSVPHAQGFQEYIGFRTGHTENYFNALLEHNGEPYSTKGYISDVLADEAMHFMKTSDAKPFLCYVPFNAPHTPLDVPQEYLEKYSGKGLPDRVARIYAMMENLDDNIGRLMNFLKESGNDKNTIVMFMSDNGPLDVRTDPKTWRYNVGLRDQKFSVYEGGIRTRFFLRWPAKYQRSRVVTTPAAHIDILPTLVDLCSLRMPAVEIDGHSLRKLLEGKRDKSIQERKLFLNYSLTTLRNPKPYPGGIVRYKQYKMVDGDQLYNLNKDPGERINLASTNKTLLVELDSAYRQWWRLSMPVDYDVLPISIGYAEEQVVAVAPHLGRVNGGLEYSGLRGLYSGERKVGRHPTGVDGDWVTNWKSPSDTIFWKLRVVSDGFYTLSVTARSDVQVSPDIAVNLDGQFLKRTILLTSDSEWSVHKIGEIWLNVGEYPLSVFISNLSTSNSLALKNVLISFQE